MRPPDSLKQSNFSSCVLQRSVLIQHSRSLTHEAWITCSHEEDINDSSTVPHGQTECFYIMSSKPASARQCVAFLADRNRTESEIDVHGSASHVAKTFFEREDKPYYSKTPCTFYHELGRLTLEKSLSHVQHCFAKLYEHCKQAC